MTELLAPPYPADTRAKGWRFELDYEQIDQSDTWDLAAEVPMAQHALLMMWLVAWRQKPCGAFPADEATIRAKCKVPQKLWAQCRDLLMRGWWQASDGLLYHDTIIKRVREMMEYRKKESERRNKNRSKHDGEPPLSRGTQAGQVPESHETPDTGTGTSSTPSVQKKARKSRSAPVSLVPADLAEAGFSAELAAEFIACKASREAPLTARAWADHLREAEKAGWSPIAAAEKVMAKTWKGFEAKYVSDKAQPAAHSAKSFRETDLDAKRAEVAAWTGGILGRKPAEIIDMETTNGSVRRLG